MDIEAPRDPVTGRRRRVSKFVHGSRAEAELALAKLKVAGGERRLAQLATSARTVRNVFDLYVDDAMERRVPIAPKTIVTSRSARNTMCRMRLPNGRPFGDLVLSELQWSDIEELYAAMRDVGLSTAWIRRCATVLNRALVRAVKHGLLPFNPCADADRPKLIRRKPGIGTG